MLISVESLKRVSAALSCETWTKTCKLWRKIAGSRPPQATPNDPPHSIEALPAEARASAGATGEHRKPHPGPARAPEREAPQAPAGQNRRPAEDGLGGDSTLLRDCGISRSIR